MTRKRFNMVVTLLGAISIGWGLWKKDPVLIFSTIGFVILAWIKHPVGTEIDEEDHDGVSPDGEWTFERCEKYSHRLCGHFYNPSGLPVGAHCSNIEAALLELDDQINWGNIPAVEKKNLTAQVYRIAGQVDAKLVD